ncbi:uncharacterized protein MKK02DRAFT_39795 [Dioszegia hungarica]|uniref:Uncharacterized protein n=1 Tax=Dioszegia hungarica TaxID=4972 RepID=A0AA38LY60_9TREE|nr:uncharacterized protein MKK02DRAFT_39795 [Dioszegia hungarica]KAI9639493.1 hypothetical protein MKK02DRAFT_39795 [Dioszegia hungarica]
MSDPPPSLDSLPPHAIEAIAGCLDERGVYALMATSRYLREEAEPALKAYFTEKRVVAEPALAPDVFTLIDPILAWTGQARDTRLQEKSDILDAQITHFPSSAIALRKLTIELADNHAARAWEHLHRFAEQLHHLELHVRDTYFDHSVQYGGDDSVARFGYLGTPECWDDCLTETFANLTRLTMICSGRGAEHFARLAPLLPQLQELSLSSHFRGPEDMDQPELITHAAPFPSLARLTLAGHAEFVIDVLREILPHAPITHLILHISERISTSTLSVSPFRSIQPLLELINDDGRELEGLALYGWSSYDFSRCLRAVQDGENGWNGAFQRLSRLILGRDEDKRVFHLLDDKLGVSPSLPSLRRLAWIDRPVVNLFPRRRTSGESPPAPKLYEDDQLRALFERYPISHAQWLDSYPSDPFRNEHTTAKGATSAKHIKCTVYRQNGDAPLRAFRPAPPIPSPATLPLSPKPDAGQNRNTASSGEGLPPKPEAYRPRLPAVPGSAPPISPQSDNSWSDRTPRGWSPRGGSLRGGSTRGGSPRGGSPSGWSPRGGSQSGWSPRGGSQSGWSPSGGSPRGGSDVGPADPHLRPRLDIANLARRGLPLKAEAYQPRQPRQPSIPGSAPPLSPESDYCWSDRSPRGGSPRGGGDMGMGSSRGKSRYNLWVP